MTPGESTKGTIDSNKNLRHRNLHCDFAFVDQADKGVTTAEVFNSAKAHLFTQK